METMVEPEQASTDPPAGPPTKHTSWIMILKLDSTRKSKTADLLRANKGILDSK
jgi:hypothetical protein